VLVPCAGYGHDAIAWANAGHEAVAVDFAALAVARAKDIARTRGAELQIEQADLFNLSSTYAEAFDLVWEQTCLAALIPDRRGAYFEAMAWALRPGGDFYGLLWNHGRRGGPPYDINRQLVEELAEPAFLLKRWHPLEPDIALRRGEFLVHLQKR
jgi:SAM-dependent methyltransferase